MRRGPAIAVLGAGLAVVAGCSGSGAGPGPTSAPSSAPSGPSPSSSGSSVSSASPTGSLPSLPALPSDLAGSDPCAHADSAFTAASVYLGLAQLGRTDEAQRCVRGDGVPTGTTTALVASGVAAFYVPSGSTTGPSIRFVPASGGTAVTVTTAASAGRYGVTEVRRG